METTKVTKKEETEKLNDYSMKSALYSTLLFVGGGIVFFIVLLFVFYMIRI